MLRAFNIFLMPLKLVLSFFHFLLFWPVLCLAKRSPSFWRFVLNVALALKIKSVAGFAPRLCLEFERASQWREVEPLLTELKARDRNSMASAFAMLYLRLQRWEEAREAVRFWKEIPERWVREHPQEASEAVGLYRSLSLWYPFGIPNIAPGNIHPPTSMEGIKVLKNAAALDGGMMTEWANSRLVGEILGWVFNRAANEDAEIPILRDSLFPFLPMPFDSVHSARVLVAQLGIGRSAFQQMWRRATTLPDENKKPRPEGRG